jgi:dCMP deaminase
MLVGIAGKVGCGKDTVAEMLSKRGYSHISLSDILRDDLRRIGKEVTRENLIETGASIRKNHGANILAVRAYGMNNSDKAVFTSIGRTEEASFLKGKGVSIVYVEASPKKRFERIVSRSREKDPVTFEEFSRLEKIESEGKNLERNMDDIKKISDIIITNDGALSELEEQIGSITMHIRPGWDSYFFEIMNTVAKRATCGRGRAGAIIVKDNQILTTGYVGSPPGLPHCDDVGHLMIKTVHPDGIEREHCIRTTHAEQNAIAQAAKNGISLHGATIYIRMEPCFSCAKQIIGVGIKRIVCLQRYQAGQSTRKMLDEAGIELIVKDDSVLEYEK